MMEVGEVPPDQDVSSDVLVAGGAGFLGSHLCEALVARGYSVLAVDDLSTGRRRNVEHLPRDRFRLLLRDVRHPSLRSSRESGWRGRYIYNLASPASPAAYQRDPVRTLLVNVVGTFSLLSLAADTGARYLQASTSEVYGNPRVHPQPESSPRPGHEPAMTRASARRRRSASTSDGPGRPMSGSRVSSTPTVRGWTRRTGGWSPTSSARLSAGSR
jgi:nucleoside-diphosphate-sugar epimerase